MKDIETLSREILELLPQKAPFRFLDRIVEVDEDKITGQYTYKKDESFYAGHFPGKPMTPGVIMVETMAQTAVVAFGIYLLLKEREKDPTLDPGTYLSVFTDVEAEFMAEIPPGETVTIKAEKLFWRRRKLKCKAELYRADGKLAASATLAGLGIKRTEGETP